MNDHSSVVDDLRAFLQSSDQVVTEQISGRAARYAQLCTETNQRLRRCEEFLRKGLRAEAIQFAQTEPPLLEIFFALDFPERGHWDEVTTAYGLTVPPRLNVDAARALQQAVADAEPLSDLLRQHRLLALGRGPLVERLRVLRKLNEADPTNPLWPECVQSFEKARLRTLEAETEEAIRKKDIAAVTRLHAEVVVGRWLVKPPAGLVKRLTDAAQEALRGKARGELTRIEKLLNDAYSQGNLEACRQYRDQWQQVVGSSGLPANDPLHEKVAPALEWIDGQEALAAADQAYQVDVHALEQGLNGILTRDQLENLMRAVQRHGRGFPPKLAEECRDRRQRMIRAEKMRNYLVFGGAAAALLLVIAVAVIVYRQGLESQNAEKLIAKVREELDQQQNPAGANEILQNIKSKLPSMYEREDIQALQTEVDRSLKSEEQRLALLKDALDQEKPDEAAKHAKKPTELAQVQSLRDKLASRENAEYRKKIEQFETKVNQVKEEVATAEKEPNPTERTFSTVVAKLNELGAEATALGADQRAKIESLSQRIKKAELAMTTNRRRLDLEKAIDASVPVGDLPIADYVASLEAFAKGFPDEPRSADFTKVVAEQKRWQGLHDWSKLLKEIGDRPLDVAPKDAKSRADKIRAFLDSNPEFPEAEPARRYVEFLDALSERDEDNPNAAIKMVKTVYTSPINFKLVKIFNVGNRTYYTRQDIEAAVKRAKANNEATTSGVKYMQDFEGKEQPKPFPIGNSPDVVEGIDTAPPGKLALAWEASNSEPWERRVINHIETIRRDPRLHPIAKCKYMRDFVSLATATSAGMRDALSKHRKHFEEADFEIDGSLWINPDEKLEEQTRKALARLQEFPDCRSATEKAAEHDRRIEADLKRTQSAPIGWLAKDRSGTWTCHVPARVTGQSRDHVVCMLSPDGESSKWVVVGTLTDGKVQLLLDSSRSFVEGRLLFLHARP